MKWKMSNKTKNKTVILLISLVITLLFSSILVSASYQKVTDFYELVAKMELHSDLGHGSSEILTGDLVEIYNDIIGMGG